MKMTEDTKKNIEGLVEDYKRTFVVEYNQFLEQMRINAWTSKEKFGEIKGADMVERKIIEYPETLFTIFLEKLSDTDMLWLTSKPGARWFANRFQEFKAVSKI